MLVNSIPIYWGNPKMERDFNTGSFLNVHDFRTFDDAIDRIIEIDNNESLYRQYLQQPYFHQNEIPSTLTEENILNRFEIIFKHKIQAFNGVRLSKQKASFAKKDFHLYSSVLRKKINKLTTT